MDLREIGWGCVECIQLAQDRGCCKCCDECLGSGTWSFLRQKINCKIQIKLGT
jgi:hypothetical protein